MLTGVLESVATSGMDRPAAGLWWSADQTWFVAIEIHCGWTFAAREQALMDRLLAHDQLEAAPTTFGAATNRAAEPS